MTTSAFAALVVLVLVVLVVFKKARRRGAVPRVRRRGSGVGPGASGTIYELLNEERRNAIEIIVEDRAGYRDPEDADGNLPDLEDPGGAARRSRRNPS